MGCIDPLFRSLLRCTPRYCTAHQRLVTLAAAKLSILFLALAGWHRLRPGTSLDGGAGIFAATECHQSLLQASLLPLYPQITQSVIVIDRVSLHLFVLSLSFKFTLNIRSSRGSYEESWDFLVSYSKVKRLMIARNLHRRRCGKNGELSVRNTLALRCQTMYIQNLLAYLEKITLFCNSPAGCTIFLMAVRTQSTPTIIV